MAAAQRKPVRAKSIQREQKLRLVESGSSTARLQAQTIENAHRIGQPWDDDEVAILANEIAKDSTTFDIAMKLGRSYYGTQTARSHVGFAMRHATIFARILK